jgi:DNA helicase II / ATP-dependent DNA helicase PcrA
MSSTVAGYRGAVDELKRNAEQWTAFESKGNCVTLAGPGSGKTKVLTAKLARMLLEDVRSPRGAACVTFNNECARELERRLALLGMADRPNVFVGTLHSFCLRFVIRSLGRFLGGEVPLPIRIASERVQRKAFDDAVAAMRIRGEDLRLDLDRFRRTAIDRVVGRDGWEPGDGGLTDLCLEYERRIRGSGHIDFDDIVLLSVRAVEGNEFVRRCLRARFPILLVDEYQDLGVPLHRLVLQLCFASGVRLFAVGDPDQSIYGFTGARPDLLRDLAGRGDVESVVLHTNYRSGRRIVAACGHAIGCSRKFPRRWASRIHGVPRWPRCAGRSRRRNSDSRDDRPRRAAGSNSDPVPYAARG